LETIIEYMKVTLYIKENKFCLSVMTM